MNKDDNLQQPRVLLATSLAPRDLDNQRQAVQSWIQAGFDVISVNNPDEIPMLQPHFSAVRFIAASRNGARLYGKPLIFIDDILDALKSPNRPIVGIINSDIHLLPDPDLWRQITRNAKNALLYLRRTNVNYLGDPNGELLVKGIDLFFMSQSTLRRMPSSQFCLGVSWWDVYFPAYCAMTGIPLKKMDAPIAFHIKHIMNWDERQWQQSAEHFYQCMYHLSRYAQQPSMLAENENHFLSLWKFYHGIRHNGVIPKGSQRMIGSKLVHHIINQATQTLNCPPLSVPAVQQDLHDDTLQLFQKAQDAFESGQMLSARKWMAQYQAQMNYSHLPRTDRRNQASRPEMSVVIVTCGRSRDVSLLLDDLSAQTWRDFETILVDNGHTDLSLVQNKADCIIHCPLNFKPAEGRNIGVHAARGQILVFIDDDARIPKDYLTSIKRAFQTYRILGLRGKTLPKTPSADTAAAIGDLGSAPVSAMCNQEGNAAFLAWAWRAVAGQDPLLFGHEGIDLSWRLKQAFKLDNAILYWPDAVIYHDYGDGFKKREKKIRYVQIGNYLQYKYDCDITLRLQECQKQPLDRGDAQTWSIPMPADLNRWRSLCYVPMDKAIGALPGVKVSIIISCYNAEPFLAECLDSICAQTITDWEAIIVDDGSKDRSPEILRQYAARDGRFRIYLNQDNKGPYQRRNFAIQQAKAPFIVLHDADDIMAPQKLEILLGEILKDDRLGIVGSFYGWFRGQFEGLDCCDRIALIIAHEEIIRAFLLRHRDICCHAAAIIRKSLFEQIGLYDAHPWGADSFWLTKAGVYMVLTNQVRCKNVPEYLSFIRKHSESQTGKINPNDPRGRRRHFVQYFRAKLQDIVEKRKQDPYLDVAAHLRQCTCSDFIPMYGHLFEQWESEPLDMFMIKCRMDTVVSELVNRMYVRTEMNLNTLESILPQAGQKAAGFNLMRGLCQFVFGQYTDARESMLSEYQLHQTVQAKRFLDLYLNCEQINCNITQRRSIVDNFIFNYPEIEHPAAEVVFDNRTAAAGVSVIVDCRFSQVDLVKLTALWSRQQTRDFELVLITHKTSKSDFASLGGLPLNLVVVNTDQAVTRATAKNLVVPNCRGDIVAFISPHLLIPDTLLGQMIDCFAKNDVSAVRGKILTRDILLPHPEYHLGNAAHYSCADTDQFCAVRRREIEHVGGFDGGLFGRELLGLSHAIYNQKPDCVLPILYQPKLEGIINTDVQTTDYLLFAIGNHQLYWRLSAPAQFDLFAEFASNYHSRGDKSKAFPAIAKPVADYFAARCMPVAMEWARKANLTLSDNSETIEQSPLVSVIMPAYNAGQFIHTAIGSALAQTHRNLELIIINDGSADNTEHVVRQFSDPRIRLETQPNAGPAAARNRGLSIAAGQFIVFLDADDAMTPEFIADHLAAFEREPQADLIYCDDQLMDADGRPERIIERKNYPSAGEMVRELFQNGYPIVPFRTCIRKRVFDKIGLYDPNLHVAEDYDMIRRFLAAGLTARHLGRAHYLRRLSPQSQSRNLSIDKARMHLGIVGKFIATFDCSWLFPQVNWQPLDTAAKQSKLAAAAAEFFLSLSLNYMKMPGHEAYAEEALRISERHIRQAPASLDLERVIQVFQQAQQAFERWKRSQGVISQQGPQYLPQVSVVLSCLNMADYLPECLDSIRKQTLESWELIVVDDGSTDGTQEILRWYAQADARIRVYFNHDTKGPYVRRNFAIGQARSPFISIQDADDIMAPQKLETLLREITAESSLGIVGSYFGQFLDTFYGPDFCDCKKKQLSHTQIMEVFQKTWHVCWHGSAIIRKSLFDTIGLYDSQPWGSDSFWLAKAGLYAQLSGSVQFKNIPQTLTYKREHERSQTGLISSIHPHSRRAMLHQYGMQKLEQIRKLKQTDSAFDFAAALRNCSCSDFIPQFGHLFGQWESTPIDSKTIRDMLECAAQECANGFYVGAAMTISSLYGISAGIEKAIKGLNLMHGVCCYAYGDNAAAQRYLQQEYDNHKTDHAMEIIKDLGGVQDGRQRRAAANQYVFDHILPMIQTQLGGARKQGPSLDSLYASAVSAYNSGDRKTAQSLFEQILAMPFARTIEQKIFGPNERKNYAGAINCYAVCCTGLADCYAEQGLKEQAKQLMTRLTSNKNVILQDDIAENEGSLLENRGQVQPA